MPAGFSPPRTVRHPFMDAELGQRLEMLESATDDVIAAATDFPDGHVVDPHSHSRGQLMHALAGVVMVSTDEGRWMVPPDHAMWIPAGVTHWVEMLGDVKMRSAYVLPRAAPGLPERLQVLALSDLMRSLIVEAVAFDGREADQARGEAIMKLILLEVPRLAERPFVLSFPRDSKLARICRDFIAAPTPHATIDAWAEQAGMSRRGFTRAFLRETGVSLSVWRRQATLFAALPRLAEGQSVTTVALDLGYDSAPAFTTMFKQMLGFSPREYRKGRRPAPAGNQASG